MKWLTFEIQREPGFRFNLIDLLLILTIVAVTFGLYQASPDSHFVWLPLYVGFSFFLFCNVFRIGNRMEVFWYLPFVALVLYAHDRSEIFWPLLLLVCEPLKILLIAMCIRRGSYRGIFSSARTTASPEAYTAASPRRPPAQRPSAPRR